MTQAYIGLGGNIGDTEKIFRSALACIASLEGVFAIQVSSFYRTSPVSDWPQPDYLNAVCKIETSLHPHALFWQLQRIERLHGKQPKPKNAPRPLDLDLLFFGTESFCDPELEIPHPRWQERLFVLVPLAELTARVPFATGKQIELDPLIRNFPSREQIRQHKDIYASDAC